MNSRIKKLRIDLSMTQTEFAMHIGLKQNSIALIESGKRNISNRSILSICREFNVNEQWLRTGEGEIFVQKDNKVETSMKTRLKILRQNLKLTQQEFADRIGIKRNSYANYEIGRNVPIDVVLKSICREFNVNEQWIRSGYGDMFIPDTSDKISEIIKIYNCDRAEATFVHEFMSLKSEDRTIILNFLKNVVTQIDS